MGRGGGPYPGQVFYGMWQILETECCHKNKKRKEKERLRCGYRPKVERIAGILPENVALNHDICEGPSKKKAGGEIRAPQRESKQEITRIS